MFSHLPFIPCGHLSISKVPYTFINPYNEEEGKISSTKLWT